MEFLYLWFLCLIPFLLIVVYVLCVRCCSQSSNRLEVYKSPRYRSILKNGSSSYNTVVEIQRNVPYPYYRPLRLSYRSDIESQRDVHYSQYSSTSYKKIIENEKQLGEIISRVRNNDFSGLRDWSPAPNERHDPRKIARVEATPAPKLYIHKVKTLSAPMTAHPHQDVKVKCVTESAFRREARKSRSRSRSSSAASYKSSHCQPLQERQNGTSSHSLKTRGRSRERRRNILKEQNALLDDFKPRPVQDIGEKKTYRNRSTGFSGTIENRAKSSSRSVSKKASIRVSKNTIDLHCLSVAVALRTLAIFLRECEGEYNKNNWIRNLRFVHVVSGRGKHSEGGIPKIKPEVQKYLDKNKYKHQWDVSGGRVTIDLITKRSTLSSSGEALS